MANCAVTSFNGGRQEPLPEEQRLAAGYVPDFIQVNEIFLFNFFLRVMLLDIEDVFRNGVFTVLECRNTEISAKYFGSQLHPIMQL